MAEKARRMFKDRSMFAEFLLIIILIIGVAFSIEEKVPYEQIPYEFNEFEGYSNSATIKRPSNRTDLDLTIASKEANNGLKVATISYLDWIDDESLRLRTITLGSYKETNGIFPESIKHIKIIFESHDNNAYAVLQLDELWHYNLNDNKFNYNSDQYVYHSKGLSYLLSEGVGHNDVGLEIVVLWNFKDNFDQNHHLEVSTKLIVGNVFGNREIVSSIEIMVIL